MGGWIGRLAARYRMHRFSPILPPPTLEGVLLRRSDGVLPNASRPAKTVRRSLRRFPDTARCQHSGRTLDSGRRSGAFPVARNNADGACQFLPAYCERARCAPHAACECRICPLVRGRLRSFLLRITTVEPYRSTGGGRSCVSKSQATVEVARRPKTIQSMLTSVTSGSGAVVQDDGPLMTLSGRDNAKGSMHQDHAKASHRVEPGMQSTADNSMARNQSGGTMV